MEIPKSFFPYKDHIFCYELCIYNQNWISTWTWQSTWNLNRSDHDNQPPFWLFICPYGGGNLYKLDNQLFISTYAKKKKKSKLKKKIEKKKRLDVISEKKKKKYNTPDSNLVPHGSTNGARSCLTSLSGREAVLSWWYGRTCSNGQIYSI